MLNIQILRGSTASKNVTFLGHGFPLKYCTTFGPRVAFIRVILTNDILFMFLMVWTSIYMVTLLHRHQKFRFGPRARKPRKSQSREPLKQSFTWWHFFLINSFLIMHISFSHHKDFNQQCISVFFSSSVLCPLVLINSDSRVFKVLCALPKRRR